MIKQNRLGENLAITGIPYEENENLNKIFKRICGKLKTNISNSDIRMIYRNLENKKVIVKFKRLNTKLEFLRRTQARHLWPEDIVDVKANKSHSQISFVPDMTPYYADMWYLAEKARKRGIIHFAVISFDGIVLQKHKNGAKFSFVAKADLKEFLKKAERDV